MKQGPVAGMSEGHRRMVAIALCCLFATLGWRVPTVLAIAAVLIFVGRSQFLESLQMNASLHRLENFAQTSCQGDMPSRLKHIANILEEVALRDPERVSQRHAMTGVATREPLLAAMASDGHGMLGIVRLVDFDRMSAFDPALGHQLLIQATTRLKGMLPASRMLAHVDRAHLAIWFGPEVEEASARMEMDAITYALGEALNVNGRKILPDVKVQLSRLEGDEPPVLLARILARLVLAQTDGTVSAVSLMEVGGPQDDYELEQDLRQAMSAGELQLRYQPLIDANMGRVRGAEALIRWQHPQRGMISPSRFIPILEAAGLAHEVGLWAINTACREARSWKTADLLDLRVAVNVSAYQLDRGDLPALVARTLERHALQAECFEIELTESAALVDSDHARSQFAQLRDLGISIAIDDFGTGFSSLSSLCNLAFDKIKIDREFVTHVESRKESQAICQSIIALARGLGITVLAEGVERVEEYAWLRRHGCNKFQGYFFSHPLEGPAFVSFVRDREQLIDKLDLGPRSQMQEIAERLSV